MSDYKNNLDLPDDDFIEITIDCHKKAITLVDMKFTNKPHCINIDDRFLFRSCRTMGIGRIISVE
jgi:GTPase